MTRPDTSMVYADSTGGISHGQATIAGAATLRAANPSRRSITIQNLGAGTLYVGSAGVDTSTGFQLATGQALTLTRSTEPLYVNASGSCDVRFIEEVS